MKKVHGMTISKKMAEEVRYFVQVANRNYMGYTFNTSQKSVLESACDEGVRHGAYIEVPESALPYLVKPDVAIYGEMEFRKCVYGVDMVMAFYLHDFSHAGITLAGKADHTSGDSFISGYRWCKPRKKVVEWTAADVPPVCWLRWYGLNSHTLVLRIFEDGLETISNKKRSFSELMKSCEFSTDLKEWLPCSKESS